MIINVQILESDSKIRNLILDSIKDHMEGAFTKAIPPIYSEIKTLMTTSLKTEPEYQSLIGGTLRVEFGIENVSDVDQVVAEIVDTLQVTKHPIKINNLGLTGGFVMTMIPSADIGGVIGSSAAIVSDSAKGHRLPWLEWLLLHANKPIIRNYEVKVAPNPYSRSGMGIMVESDSDWRVPPEFAGNQQDNWTTRAVSRIENQLPTIFENNILKNI